MLPLLRAPAGPAGAVVLALSCAAAGLSPAVAQQPPPLPGIIERVAPVEPPRLSPSPLPAAPEARRGPGEDRVLQLRRVELRDATVLTAAALGDSLAGLEGQAVPLRQIEDARIAILAAFRAAGYPFTAVNATLTPTPDGAFDLAFAVVEAHVAEIRLDGDIGPAATQALRFAEPLRRLTPLPAAALERALLLISDIPGVSVQGVLQPMGDTPGALRLVLRLERQPFSGVLTLDNRAWRGTGPFQALAVLQANSFTEFGERTEVSLYGTEALSQRFAQVAGEWFLGGSGLKLRAWIGQGESEPRGPLAALGYLGTSTVAGVQASYPLIRSRPANLTLSAGYDLFRGAVDAGPIAARDEVQVLRLGAQGQLLDPIALGPVPAGTTIGQVRLHQGMGGSVERSSRAGARDVFTKVTAELQRNQPLAELPFDTALGLQVLASGQWSSEALPSAEKFLLGGARLARGYYAGQASGDSGWAASAEIQIDRGFDVPAGWGLPVNRLGVQAYAFRDHGKALQIPSGERDVTLSSWGGGLRFFLDRRVQVETELARRLERRPDGAGTTALDATIGLVSLVVRY
jgi:hemolysin activation/secretion protein